MQFKNSAFDTQTINRILKLELACIFGVGEAMEGSWVIIALISMEFSNSGVFEQESFAWVNTTILD